VGKLRRPAGKDLAEALIDADMQSLTSAVNVDPGAKIRTPMKFDMPTILALIVLWILLGFMFYTLRRPPVVELECVPAVDVPADVYRWHGSGGADGADESAVPGVAVRAADCGMCLGGSGDLQRGQNRRQRHRGPPASSVSPIHLSIFLRTV
jgi:hypothetical protein